MDAEFFGLSRPPFRATGTYPGPQQLAVAGGLRRALVSPDSVLAVTGPAGVGKSVSVTHALARLECEKIVTTIGRNHIAREDILEVLLERLGVDPLPASTTRRVDAVHEVFRARARNGGHLFIVIEDAERLGEETLAELETLTAADGDVTPGAHLILQGYPGVERFLESPLLERLRQRMRRRMEIEPYSEGETRAYIGHAITIAGGRLDELFDDEALRLVHDASRGLPRVINALCEAMLFSAAESGVARVSATLADTVARDDFGYAPGAADDSTDELYAGDIRANDAAIASSPADVPQAHGSDTAPVAKVKAHAPATYSKSTDPVDTQTLRALNDALRPDTQLLETLGGSEAVAAAAPARPAAVETPEPTTSHTATVPAGHIATDVIDPQPALSEPDVPEVAAAEADLTITLDDSINKHQQEAQARVREEAERIAALQAEAAAAEAPAGRRNKPGAATQNSASRSLEDIVNDTATEAVFDDAGVATGGSGAKAADNDPTATETGHAGAGVVNDTLAQTPAERLEMLRQLKQGQSAAQGRAQVAAPESIEDQFGESMTARLKAMTDEAAAITRTGVDDDDDDEFEPPQKRGFLSRLRRT